MSDYNIAQWLDQWLLNELPINEQAAVYVKLLILVIALTIVSILAWHFTKRLMVRAINSFFMRTKAKWDDVFVKEGVFLKLAHIVPAIIVNFAAPYVFGDFPEWIPAVKTITDLYIIGVFVWSINSVISSSVAILSQVPALKDKPLGSYSQLIKVVVFLVGAVLMFSILLGQSPIAFLSAMGAATAIILLIFKDAILGFVASIQMSAYNMIRVGDWVSMPKYDADGDVIAINLTTVQIQNWDKTISTVPAYSFISDSFKNWRGMSESGGRRIKRSVNIKISSIRFCDAEMVKRFKKFHLVKDYVEQREKEIEQYNLNHAVDKSELINGRQMTNIGVFRNYARNYLAANPKLNQQMTLMVRQLQPTETGLPLEIYCFSANKEWVNYEGIISDIFDHLLAAIPAFDLVVFEAPTGQDFQALSTAQVNQQSGN